MHAHGRMRGKIHGLLVTLRVVRSCLGPHQSRVAEQVVDGRALEHLLVLLRAVLADGGLPLELGSLEGSGAPRAKAAADVELVRAESTLVPLRLLGNLAEGIGAESTFLVHISKYAAVCEGVFGFRRSLRDLALEKRLLLGRGHFLVAGAVITGSRYRVASDGLVLGGESLVLGNDILAQLVCQNREHLAQLLTHLESLTRAFEAGDGLLRRLPVAEDALGARVRSHVERPAERVLVGEGHVRHGLSVYLALRQGGVQRSWVRKARHLAHVDVQRRSLRLQLWRCWYLCLLCRLVLEGTLDERLVRAESLRDGR